MMPVQFLSMSGTKQLYVKG